MTKTCVRINVFSAAPLSCSKPCQSYSQDSENFKLVSMPVDYVGIDMNMEMDIFEWMDVESSSALTKQYR